VVALKRLPRDGADVESSFLREQTVLAQAPMGHPNLMRLFATVDDGPTRGLVFELFPRGSLDQFLRSTQPLEPATAVRVAIAAIRGAAALHSVGIVHRAIRPAHIMLESDLSDAHLAGFGAAVRLEAATEAATLVPNRYTPPETLDAAARPAPNADVWQLGLLALNLITRKPPFASHPEEADALAALAAAESPGTLTDDARDQSPFLASVMDLAIVHTPSGRPATAAAMLSLL